MDRRRGRGTIYSFSIQRRVAEPYVIAYVTLQEGPTIMTNIVDIDDIESVSIGQGVQLDWRRSASGGYRYPVFKPVA